MRQTLVLHCNDSKVVRLVFGLRRAPLQAIQALGMESQAFPEGHRDVTVAWKEAPKSGEVALSVEVGDERLVVVRETYAGPSTDVKPLFEGATPTDLREDLAPLLEAKPTPREEILAWREQRESGEHAADIRFFNRLERQTETDDTTVWKPIDTVGDTLRARALADDAVLARLRLGLRLRQRGAARPYARDSGALELAPQDLEDLDTISRIFIDCARAFGDQPARPLAHALLRFAIGSLMLLRPDDLPAPRERLDWMAKACQPNSGLHFYFAELADACLTNDVHVEFWKPLYPAFVSSLELFWQTYRQSNAFRLPIGYPVARMELFRSPIPATKIPELLEGFEQSCAGRVSDVHRRFVQWYLAPLV